VTMVHVSGWVFRKQRLNWQIKKLNKHSPEEYLCDAEKVRDYLVGDEVRSETATQRIERIKIELAEMNLGPLVFID